MSGCGSDACGSCFCGSGERATRSRPAAVLADPFAGPEDCPGYSGNLGAARAWIWDVDKLNDPARQETSEFQLLERVRTESGMDKGDLLAVAQEAGLMYVFGQWLHGKLTDENAKTFVEVYHAEKSKELSLALNVADTILPVAGVLAGVTGLPALGVSLAIIVAKYGFEKLTEPEPGPDA